MKTIPHVKNTPGLVLPESTAKDLLNLLEEGVSGLGLTSAQNKTVNTKVSEILHDFIEQNAIVIPSSLNDNIQVLNDSYNKSITPDLDISLVPAIK